MKSLLFYIFIASFVFVSCQLDNSSYTDKNSMTVQQVDSLEQVEKEIAVNNLAFHLSDFIPIEDSDYVFFQVEVTKTNNQSSKFSILKSGGYDEKNESWNIIFYNTQNKDYHELIKDTVGIVNSFYIFDVHSPQKTRPSEAEEVHNDYEDLDYSAHNYKGTAAAQYIFYRITFDYNKDGKINYLDPSQLYLTDRNGKNFTQLSPSHTDLEDWQFYNQSNLLIISTLTDSNKDLEFNSTNDESLVFEVNLDTPQMGHVVFDTLFTKQLKEQFVKFEQRNN